MTLSFRPTGEISCLKGRDFSLSLEMTKKTIRLFLDHQDTTHNLVILQKAHMLYRPHKPDPALQF
jgi:hypothetical protein